MHTLDEGVSPCCGGEIFQHLIDQNVYRVDGTTKDARMKQSINVVQDHLREWVKSQGSLTNGYLGGMKLSQHILVGSGGRAFTHAKAMQSRYLFFFARHELYRYLPMLLSGEAATANRSRKLKDAADMLAEFYEISEAHGYKVPPGACRRLLYVTKAHITGMQAADVELLPKHHGLVEIAKATLRNGNARLYSNYADEDFNRVVGAIASVIHPRVFAAALLKRIRVLAMVRQHPW